MATLVPEERSADQAEQAEKLEDRQRLAQLLRQAFPLGRSGTFSGLVEAIHHDELLERT